MFNKLDHVEIVPSDIQRTIDFYVDVLGFKVKQRRSVAMPPLEEVAYLELNGTVVELLRLQNAAPPSHAPQQVGYRMIALEVADMDEALRYLESKGVRPTWGPVVLGHSKRAEIKDPDGLPIELRQW